MGCIACIISAFDDILVEEPSRGVSIVKLEGLLTEESLVSNTAKIWIKWLRDVKPSPQFALALGAVIIRALLGHPDPTIGRLVLEVM